MLDPITLAADDDDLRRVLIRLSVVLNEETRDRPVTLPTLLFIGENFLQVVMNNLYRIDPKNKWREIILETLPQVLQLLPTNGKES